MCLVAGGTGPTGGAGAKGDTGPKGDIGPAGNPLYNSLKVCGHLPALAVHFL